MIFIVPNRISSLMQLQKGRPQFFNIDYLHNFKLLCSYDMTMLHLVSNIGLHDLAGLWYTSDCNWQAIIAMSVLLLEFILAFFVATGTHFYMLWIL
jgi:hypothetical protein